MSLALQEFFCTYGYLKYPHQNLFGPIILLDIFVMSPKLKVAKVWVRDLFHLQASLNENAKLCNELNSIEQKLEENVSQKNEILAENNLVKNELDILKQSHESLLAEVDGLRQLSQENISRNDDASNKVILVRLLKLFTNIKGISLHICRIMKLSHFVHILSL